jgi:glycosyltransferase
MKISLITPTYNSAATLRDTLNSVAAQDYQTLEYIIIDGASSDQTLDIINSYRDRLKITLLSEADNGLYDAMNKGISLASGEIIGILNSDDFYHDNRALKKIAAYFQDHPDSDACYSNLEFVNPTDLNKVVRFWRAGEYEEKKLNSGWIIPHPTFFVRRKIYKKFGVFRTDLKLAGDYELLLRFLKVNKIKIGYLPETFIRMRTGGASGRSLHERRQGWRELKKAWEINNLRRPAFFILRRILSKIRQYHELS